MTPDKTIQSQVASGARRQLLFASLVLWGVVAAAVAAIILTQLVKIQSTRLYLFPWCLATGIVIVMPSIYLLKKGGFHAFHPLVFPVWSYFFPAFFIGGLIVTFEMSRSPVYALVTDEATAFPLTFLYVIIGFCALALGFAAPYGRRLGSWIGQHVPDWQIPTKRILFPASVLFLIGVAYTLFGFAFGILGYQHDIEFGTFDGILYLLSLFLLEGSVILWLFVFQSERLGWRQMIVALILICAAFARSAFQGNRGSLIQFFILVAFAFSFSGRKISARHYVIAGILVVSTLILGMIYGTTFRSLKGTQDRVTIDEYVSLVPKTLSTVTGPEAGAVIDDGLTALTERLDTVSSLAVVVSNYEALAPYEQKWQINDNIYADSLIFFVPRVLWPEKPVPIDPSKFGDLYFNYSENSFAMTPIGDLLRNYGPAGVPVGMFLLGTLMRVIYSSLIEGQMFSYLRVTLFFMLSSNISFEGIYGLIIPTLFKVGIFAVLGLVIVRLCAGSLKNTA